MSQPKPGPIRILIVDDEADVRDSYRHIFSDPATESHLDARRALDTKLFGTEAGKPPPRPSRSGITFDATYCDGAQSAVSAVLSPSTSRSMITLR